KQASVSSTDQGGGKRRGGMATDGAAFYLPIWEDAREQVVHAVRDVAFKVTVVPIGVVVGGAGMTQPVWQFAACELHNIMQFVTVEVTGVESPTKGGVTFGVVACASTALFAPKQN